MVPRANWKGFLRRSLVTCPVALYPATSESEKISFNQFNRKTGHRIKYMKVIHPARRIQSRYNGRIDRTGSGWERRGRAWI
jgi:non-homologous end joining protein Ku